MCTSEYDSEFGTCEAMFNDLALSRDMNAAFQRKYAGDDNPLVSKLSATVLQHSAWPFSEAKDQTVLLPDDVRLMCPSFGQTH